jgi:RTX calcium-binding nonapeptide repeat (4 copies)
MPRLTSFRLLAPSALAALLVLTLATAAAAKTVPVDLRVLTIEGKVLADQRQYTGPVAVQTGRQADCFGTGTGGSGKRVAVPGTTALGVLRDASESDRDLRPLSITDYDFGFPGLGLCGIGSQRAQGSQFWFLKVNHRNPQISGDRAKLHGGDSVIWYLIPFSKCDPSPPYYCPPELVLRAPVGAEPGAPFAVHVVSINDAGKARPAANVKVGGADLPTDAQGNTQVALSESRHIRAVGKGRIPSPPMFVCVDADPSACPGTRGERIYGSSDADRIAGTPGPDRIWARGGADRVNSRGWGPDLVDCGPGRDTAQLGAGDTARRCEKEARRG